MADVVIDNLGGDFMQQSINAVKAAGTVVSMGFVANPAVTFDVRSLFFPQKKIKGSIMGTKEDLEYGLKLVKEGKIKAQLDHHLPLTNFIIPEGTYLAWVNVKDHFDTEENLTLFFARKAGVL